MCVHTWGNCPRAHNKSLPIGCVNCLDAKLDHSQHTANDLRKCNFVKQVEKDKNDRTDKRKKVHTGNSSSSSSSSSNGESFSPRGSRSNSPPVSTTTTTSSILSSKLSYSSAFSAHSTDKKSSLLGRGIDLEKIIAMTIRGVLEAINNGI